MDMRRIVLTLQKVQNALPEASKQITVSATSSKEQNQLTVINLINQQPIRLNMTFTKTAVISCQQMIAVFCFKNFSVCKLFYDIFDFIHIISTLCGEF